MNPVFILPHYRLGGLAVLRECVNLVNLADELADVGKFEMAGV